MEDHRDNLPERAMVQEIVQVMRDESQYEIAARRVDEITQRYLKVAEVHEQLDIKRTAARMSFIVATDRDAPFDALSERFRVRCMLGFRDVTSELAVFTDFGFACAELGMHEAGLQVVIQARERLTASGDNLPPNVVRDLSNLIELCRQRLNREDKTVS